MKVRQIRFVSLALIVAFLATSVIARTVSANETGKLHASSKLQTSSETPYGSDQQYPFEEKEKEFEDKSEASDKDSHLASNFFFICEVTNFVRTDRHEVNGLSSFNSSGTTTTGLRVPLFLSNRTIII